MSGGGNLFRFQYDEMADLLDDIADALKSGGLNRGSVHLGTGKHFGALCRQTAKRARRVMKQAIKNSAAIARLKP